MHVRDALGRAALQRTGTIGNLDSPIAPFDVQMRLRALKLRALNALGVC